MMAHYWLDNSWHPSLRTESFPEKLIHYYRLGLIWSLNIGAPIFHMNKKTIFVDHQGYLFKYPLSNTSPPCFATKFWEIGTFPVKPPLFRNSD
mgnify:CR=1 FL=1